MTEDNVLSVSSRRNIYELVSRRPGAHLRDIARTLGLPLGTALYHLDCLEQAERLVVSRDGRYKRYFVKHMLGRRDKEYVSAFHHDVPRRVAIALLQKSPLTQRELCREVGVSRSTLSFHVNGLVRRGIVACEDAWPENHYALAEFDLTEEVLRRYGDAFAGGDGPGIIAIQEGVPAAGRASPTG